ncbi:hypothetical protein GJU40_05105 [Bacillus lacus]|uniref:Uncharacterized protein n=1 Tax=Metabacillus lacus TaxID=1983721 RepID=A0A7X2IXC4_9BACI|nr:hypothetical protein [Metabacillus lacus]MRX71553.1 hypothetical protein [Metabacillus lacus]
MEKWDYGLNIGFLLILMGVHILSKYLKIMERKTLSILLSIASGVSVSYIFIHLLPKLNEYQEIAEPAFGFIENTTYYFAMVGLVFFYGLERKVWHLKDRSKRLSKNSIFWIHLISFTIYNFLIGYLLMKGNKEEFMDMLLYMIAVGVHFISVNHGLHDISTRQYDKVGRWILSISVFSGWLYGNFSSLNEEVIGILFGFLSGSIVLNLLKEELPEGKDRNFWAFALGIVLYSILLFLLRS